MIATTENLLTVLHAANVALFYKDLKGNYLFINEAGAQLVGRSVEGILGHHDRDIFAPRTSDVILLRDQHIAGLREPFAYDCRSTLADDSASIAFHSVKVAVRPPSRPNPVGLLCLSIGAHLPSDLMSDMRDLLGNLMQFRPERLLAICRRGARLNLI